MPSRKDWCTGAPDGWAAPCCREHDRAYSTHTDRDGRPITRAAADADMRRCLQAIAAKRSPLAKPVPWIYWAAVRIFGGLFWRRAKIQKR